MAIRSRSLPLYTPARVFKTDNRSDRYVRSVAALPPCPRPSSSSFVRKPRFQAARFATDSLLSSTTAHVCCWYSVHLAFQFSSSYCDAIICLAMTFLYFAHDVLPMFRKPRPTLLLCPQTVSIVANSRAAFSIASVSGLKSESLGLLQMGPPCGAARTHNLAGVVADVPHYLLGKSASER